MLFHLFYQLTWPEALETCESLSGRLVEFEDIGAFFDLVSHIQRRGKKKHSFLFYSIVLNKCCCLQIQI